MTKTGICLLGLLFVASINYSDEKRISNFAGSYRVIIRRTVDKSDDFPAPENPILRYQLYFSHPRNINQPQYFWGKMTAFTDISDIFKVHSFLSKWNNNEWKRNAFVLKFDNACTRGIQVSKKLFITFLGKNGCPIKKGVYEYNNDTFSIDFPDIPIFPYGRYLHTILILNNTQIAGTLSTELEVVPKL